jgi:hypothetical protein
LPILVIDLTTRVAFKSSASRAPVAIAMCTMSACRGSDRPQARRARLRQDNRVTLLLFSFIATSVDVWAPAVGEGE